MASYPIVGVTLRAENWAQFMAQLQSSRRAIGLFGGSVRPITPALNQANRALSSTSGTTSNLASSVRGLATAFTVPSRVMGGFSRQLITLGNSVKSVGNAIAGLGIRLSFIFTVPLATATVGAAKAAASFETEMTKILNLTNVTEQGVAELSDAVLNMAVALGQTPVELAEALYSITSAGLVDVAAAQEVLANSAKASAIGLGETEDIARTLVALLSVYGGTVQDVSKYTDQLVAIVNEGNLEAESLAPTLGRVTGLAATLGIEFDELGAYIAAFSRSGVPAEVAVTSLRSVLTTMLKPTEAAKERLNELGTSIEEVQAAIADPNIGLARTLIALTALYGDEGGNLSELIGNVRGLSGALFVTGKVADDYLTIQNNIANSAGTTAEAFERVQQTTGFQAQQLKASFAVLGTVVGSIVLPAINAVIQRILPLVQGVVQFAKTRPQIVAMAFAFAVVAAAIPPLLVLIGTLISAIGSILSLGGVVAGIFSAMISPIGLVGVALAGLAAMFAVALPKMRARAEYDAGLTEARFGEMADKIQQRTGELPGRIGTHFDQVGQNIEDKTSDIADNAFGWGGNIAIQLANGIASAAIHIVNVLIQIGEVIASWLGPGSPPKLLPDLPAWGANAMTQFMEGWKLGDFTALEDIAGTIESFLSSLGEGVNADKLPTIILNMREAVATAIQEYRTLGSVSDETVNSIISGFGNAGEQIRDYVRTMLELNAVTQQLTELQAELNAINAAFEAAVAPANKELDEIQRRRDEITDQLREEELGEILADPNAPELVRELALMELREIELRRQIRSEEELRDEQASGLEEQIRALELEQDRLELQAKTQEAAIGYLTKNNELLKQQQDILKRLAAETEKLGAAGAKAGEAAGAGFGSGFGAAAKTELTEQEKRLQELLTEGIGSWSLGEGLSITAQLEALGEKLKAPFEPLLGDDGLLKQLQNTWAEVFTALGITDVSDVTDKLSKLGETILELGKWAAISYGLLKVFNIAAALGGALGAIEGIAGIGALITGTLFSLAFLIPALAIALGWLIANADLVEQRMGELFGENGIVTTFFDLLGARINQWGREVAYDFEEWATNAGDSIESFLTDSGTGFDTWLQETVATVGTWASDTWTSISTWVTDTTGSFHQWELDQGENFRTWAEETKGAITTWIAETLISIGRWIVQTGLNFLAWWGGIKSGFVTWAEEALGVITGWVADAWQSIRDGYQDFLDAGAHIMEGLKEGLLSKVETLKTALQGIYNELKELWDKIWQTNSPSGVMHDSGQFIMQGLIEGINSMIPNLEQSALRAASVLRAGVSGQVAGPTLSGSSVVNDNRVGSQIGTVNVNNGMDLALLESAMRRAVNNAL